MRRSVPSHPLRCHVADLASGPGSLGSVGCLEHRGPYDLDHCEPPSWPKPSAALSTELAQKAPVSPFDPFLRRGMPDRRTGCSSVHHDALHVRPEGTAWQSPEPAWVITQGALTSWVRW